MAVAQTKQSAHTAQGLLPSADLAANQTSPLEFSKEQELQALRQMLLIRRFERWFARLTVADSPHVATFVVDLLKGFLDI